MALLGSFIDIRTLASIASNGSASFAHGLPAAPDWVDIGSTVNASAAASGGVPGYAVDATNVSLFALGTQTQSLKVVSIVAHSVIR